MAHKYKVINGVVHHCTNYIFKPNGDIIPSWINANAVLVHLLEGRDGEGNRIYRRQVSISCVDRNMRDVLIEEAYRILEAL